MTTTKEQADAVKSALALYLRAQAATRRSLERAAAINEAADKKARGIEHVAQQQEAAALAAYRAACAAVGGEVSDG